MQMCKQDSDLSAAAGFFVMCGFNLAAPAGQASAWQYVAGLYREGKDKMARDAGDALHLLLHDRESMEVQTECAWPSWQKAVASRDPYSTNPEWPVALLHQNSFDLIDSCSSEASSEDCDVPITRPDLVLRWIPCAEANLAATKPIVEGRLLRFGAYEAAYQMEGQEIVMSVWYRDQSRVEEAQLCLHGRKIVGETRLFVAFGDDSPQAATTIEVTYDRKVNKDGTLAADAVSLGYLYDTFSLSVGNVKHIALCGARNATIQFFNEESTTASLAPKALPKPYPKWVHTLSRKPAEDAQDSYLALRRSLLSASSSSDGTRSSPPSSVGPPSPEEDEDPLIHSYPGLSSMVFEHERRTDCCSV